METTGKLRPKLGDILIRLNLVGDREVKAALDHQAESGKLFGECLIDLGFIAQDDLSWALSSQLGLPFVAATRGMVDAELLRTFPRNFLFENLVLPMVASGDALSVVMAYPTDEITLARLGRLSGCKLSVAVGTPNAIRNVLTDLLDEPSRPDGVVQVESGWAPAPVPTALAPAELSQLLERAFAEGASLVHLDSRDGAVRVSFRVGANLINGGSFDSVPIEVLIHSLRHWLGKEAEIADGVWEWPGAPVAPGGLMLRASAARGIGGMYLTFSLRGVEKLESDSPSPPEEPEWKRIESLLERRTGLIAAVSPTDRGRNHVLGRILGPLHGMNRRGWILGPDDPPAPRSFHRFLGGSEPEVTRAFAHLDGIDVLAGGFSSLEHARPLAECAARDRLVVAGFAGNGALGFLTRLMEDGVPAGLLAESLLAVVAERLVPGAHGRDHPRAVPEFLFLEPPLRQALQDGGRTADLREAARRQGFVEIASRAEALGSVDEEVLDDLRRQSYLEDAA